MENGNSFFRNEQHKKYTSLYNCEAMVHKHQIFEGISSISVGNQENAINVKLVPVFCFLKMLIATFFYTGV